MATIQRGILSGFSGAIGSVTGAKSKGINTMRARVTKPKNPQSQLQSLSRSKFSFLQSNFKNENIYFVEENEEFRKKLLQNKNHIIKGLLKILQSKTLLKIPFSILPSSVSFDDFQYTSHVVGTDRFVNSTGHMLSNNLAGSPTDIFCFIHGSYYLDYFGLVIYNEPGINRANPETTQMTIDLTDNNAFGFILCFYISSDYKKTFKSSGIGISTLFEKNY